MPPTWISSTPQESASKLTMTQATTDLPEVTYSPESPLSQPGQLASDIFYDLYRCRELIWILFLRDLKAQFRQSLFGYLWLFLPPVMTTAVWLFLNSQKVIAIQSPDMPYPLFVMIGSTLWQTFVRLLQSPLQAFNAGKPVFTKLKVPPEAFIAAGSARALFDFAIYAMTLIPILILFQTTPNWTMLTLPLYLIALFALGTALGLLLIPIGSLYGDISQSIPLVMSFLMYITPVVYPTPKSGLAATIIQWNPVTPLIMGARDAITGMSYENIIPACIILLACSVIIFISLLSVRVAMPHLIARMGM